MIKVVQQHPSFQANYGPGWIGFVSRRDDFVAAGIDWFSRWDEVSGVPVSHVFNIVGEDKTVEALEAGVVHGSLLEYLHDPDVALLVRKPRALTNATLAQIVLNAELHIGERYNNELILALAASETYTGRLMNWLTRGWWEKILVNRADRPNAWVCSKLVSVSMMRTALLNLGGCLGRNPALNMPIDVFEDEKVFEPGAFELMPQDQKLEWQ